MSSQELQQTIDILSVREIAEKILSTLLLMFVSSCYFIQNARRETGASKEFDIAMQIKLWLNPEIVVQKCSENFLDFNLYS